MKQLIVVRGAQGSGKSTEAAVWANHPKARWYEADQIFEDRNGNYDFDASWLHLAHDWCLRMVENALDNPEVERVVVSNCFATTEQIKPYVLAAKIRGAEVRVLLKFEKHPNEHGVPDRKVEAVRQRMEPYIGEYICASGKADMDRLVETYPKYRDVYVDLPKGDGFESLPRVVPAPGTPGFSEYALDREPVYDEEDK